jgi:AraC-like DNA-binding protein
MDYYDIGAFMKKWTDVIYLEDRLWCQENLLRRSDELTPLYIERYRGPRMHPALTSHPFWELSCVVSGAGTLDGDEKQILQAHTIYLVPPDVKHCESTEKSLDTIWIGLRGNKLPDPGNEIMLVKNEYLTKKIVNLWRMAERRHGHIGSELDGRLSVIMGQFFRQLLQHKNNETHSITDAVKYMQDNFTEQISFADLAKEAGYSEGHFYRSFKRLTGETPSHFLTSIRIRHAYHMLQYTNFTLSEIATLSGFNEQFYFSRVFKKWIGVSPNHSRKKF